MKRNLTYIPDINVKAEEQIESLRRLVSKKKANDEKISMELLRTQYKNPYEKLLKEIRDCAGKVLYWQTIGSLRFNRDVDGQSCYHQLMAFLNERNFGEFGRCSWQLLMSEYNVDGYIHHIESIRKSVLDIWMEYWQKHCITYMTSESIGMNGMGLPRIYNTLTKNFLIDVEHNTWEKHPEWLRENTSKAG